METSTGSIISVQSNLHRLTRGRGEEPLGRYACVSGNFTLLIALFCFVGKEKTERITEPKRAGAKQQPRGPKPREVRGSEPEAVRIWLLGGFRISVGSRSIGGEEE